MPDQPAFCVQAAHSSNMSASVCLAQVDDARGDTRSALKYWAKAAKLGHPEAQFRLGRVRVDLWFHTVALNTRFFVMLTIRPGCTHQAVALELSSIVCDIPSFLSTQLVTPVSIHDKYASGTGQRQSLYRHWQLVSLQMFVVPVCCTTVQNDDL